MGIMIYLWCMSALWDHPPLSLISSSLILLTRCTNSVKTCEHWHLVKCLWSKCTNNGSANIGGHCCVLFQCWHRTNIRRSKQLNHYLITTLITFCDFLKLYAILPIVFYQCSTIIFQILLTVYFITVKTMSNHFHIWGMRKLSYWWS